MNIGETTVKCAVCGKEFETYELYSSSFFGSADLDGRADDGTLEFGATKCPCCGYVARDIEEENDISKDWNNIKKKLDIGNLHTKSDEFYALYKIAKYQNNLEDGYYNLLSACWSEEDNVISSFIGTSRVVDYRNQLIELTPKMIKVLEDDNEIEEVEIREIDFLRRNKRFDEAIKLATKYIDSKREILSSVAKYEIKLSNDRSTKKDTIKAAIKYSKDCYKYIDISNKLIGYEKKEQILNLIKKIFKDKNDDKEFYRLVNLSIDKNKDYDSLIKSLNALAKLEVSGHEF